jgi:hypothetical protein
VDDWSEWLFDVGAAFGVALGFGGGSGVGENLAVIRMEVALSDHCAEVSASEVYLPTLK